MSALASNLEALLSDLQGVTPDVPLGLVVQEYVDPIMRGHLSNERRVAEEIRDAEILSIQISSGEMKEYKIGHRNWRRSGRINDGPLVCNSEEDIKKALREPLALAAQRGARMHYEWVWDGKVVHVVQADDAPDDIAGEIPPEWIDTGGLLYEPPVLRRFRIAGGGEATDASKLRSHMEYKASGFWQPNFYVLDDPNVIGSILEGVLPGGVEDDLNALVSAPLMIRTSYTGETIPLLPRSPVLRDVDAAKAWLIRDFATAIREKGLLPAGVTLLAHHYVPALGAAFSFSAPGESNVIVESLWGVPEGLYYYPCDDYIVSTPPVLPRRPDDFTGFGVSSQVHFKSHFVMPNSDGRFAVLPLRPPWDWKKTIYSDHILYQMARFTRWTAESKGHGVNIMWFLGCRTPDGVKELIPWYQGKQDALADRSDFRPNARDVVVTISNSDDLALAQTRRSPPDSGRFVFILSPGEHVALRDDSLARAVGNAAADLNAIVLLKGARLSHIYYLLTKAGAEVITKPIGDRYVQARYTKLVRDGIPEKVLGLGESVKVAWLSPEELLLGLKVKLIEEAFEVRDAQPDEIVEELADVHEVYLALVRAAGLDLHDVEAVRAAKAESRGGFDDGIQLLETTFPAHRPTVVPLLGDGAALEKALRSGRAQPFERVLVGGSDLRRGGAFREFVRDLSVSLSSSSWRHTLKAIGIGDVTPDVVTVSLDARRYGASLKLRIKLQIGGEQLELPFTHEGDADGDQ
ncbi:MAG: nucleoside triphosphate pyrophosphohydrolase [Gemmatimonadota bacterium]|nr:nucleoside triphosphate pyrophosphohydrolase [Gemmatimonadota bacterium]